MGKNRGKLWLCGEGSNEKRRAGTADTPGMRWLECGTAKRMQAGPMGREPSPIDGWPMADGQVAGGRREAWRQLAIDEVTRQEERQCD